MTATLIIKHNKVKTVYKTAYLSVHISRNYNRHKTDCRKKQQQPTTTKPTPTPPKHWVETGRQNTEVSQYIK